MSDRVPPPPPVPTPTAKGGAWRPTLVVAVGLFATGLGWPGLIGRLPFGLLLKNTLHLPAHQVAAFWAVATFAWYVKPLIGLLCDTVPLFGTRRRGYLVTGTVAAAGAWLAFAFLPPAYVPFLATMTILNLALVVVSTAVGGLLVEVGQREGATGRLSALRSGLEGAMSLVAGPVGGFLAATAFTWTSLMGAAVVALMLPATVLLHDEPRAARARGAVWPATAQHLRRIAGSRPMWTASTLLFLVYVTPGMQTPLMYVQQDVLKLDARFMGLLQLAGGAGALAGAAVYTWLCRHLPLRPMLMAGLVLNAVAALLYLGYRSATAALVIDTTGGFLVGLGTLPLYDLAVRATPKGSESFGYALMMSVRAIAMFGLSDVLGSALYERLHTGFAGLVWINAASSAAVLLFVPFLPASLLAAREGKQPPTGK
jgi:Na+/melibiose symporter-like transporter